MSYDLPAWAESTEITSARMSKYPLSVTWRHERISYLFDLGGNLVEHTGGVGKTEGYLFINPYEYPGYAGAGTHFGQFVVSLPAGLYDELLFFRAQTASASNPKMSASISGEGPSGVTVFVYDSSRTTIGGFALWITAIGKLKAGVLP